MGTDLPHALTSSSVKAHPYYPSFAAISDALEECNLETLAIRLPALQHDVIPLPAIAHLDINQGQFVVIRSIDKNKIEYIEAERGVVNESIEQFQTKYSGNILLVAASEFSENNSAVVAPSKSVATQWQSYGKYILIAIALVFMIRWNGFATEELIYRTLYIVSLIAAVAVSVMLVAFQQGAASRIQSRLCDQSKAGGCREVLNSRAARIAGISLADIGVVYFGGTLIAFLLGDIAGLSGEFAGYLWLMSLITLPFPAYSVYYQKFKVSAWCPLCLTVAALLVAQAILLTVYVDQIRFQVGTWLTFLSGYLLAPGIWLITRPLYERALQADKFKQAALALKQNPLIIAALLREQADIPLATLEHDIVLGNPQASFTITLVVNPECGPCKSAYSQVETILSRFRTRLKVVIRFVGAGDRGPELSRYLIQLSLKDMRHVEEALSAWFVTGTLPASYADDQLNSPAVDYATRIYSQHLQWAARAGITTTPLIIINTKPLPHQLELQDLAIYLREILSPVTGQRSASRSGAMRAGQNSPSRPVRSTAGDVSRD